jgi:2-polyprenyl-6-methoxyphenol hydroxylase-like FAD-dependent oxidoreductase
MNHFLAVRPDETVLYEKYLDNCIAISREDLHQLFRDNIVESDIVFKKEFRSFSHSEGKQFIDFTDGTKYLADLYAGVDGIRSSVREHLFGEYELSEVGEREIVCMVEMKYQPYRLDQFYKVVDSEKGKTIGIIPLSSERFIWFLQFNHFIDPLDSREPSEMRAYAMRSIEHFPEKVRILVNSSNFDQSFLWVSQRMDHLPSYYKDNCVLLGDAAHPLLPLTSQGANSALEDAATLASVFSNYRDETDISGVLKRYESMRRNIVDHYITDGDALAEDFMLLSTNKKFKLPLTIH